MKYISWKNIELKNEEIYRRMGLSKNIKENDAKYGQILERMHIKVHELIDARCVYTIVSVGRNGPQEVLLDGHLLFKCYKKLFYGATEAVVAVVTLGSRLEEETMRMFKEGNSLSGLVLDAFGTAAIDEMLGMLRHEIANGLLTNKKQMGYNVSPGGQIPLETQRAIFSLIPCENIGVSLNNSYMMIPQKSHSVIIPIGERLAMPNSECTVTCKMCSEKYNCVYSQFRLSK